MKSSILRTTMFLGIYFNFFLVQAREYVPDFSIVKSEQDKTLLKSEAIFVFQFYDEYGFMKNKNIKYSYNETNKTEKTDSLGKIILKVKPGGYKFQFFYNNSHYEIKTDSVNIKPAYKTEAEVRFRSSEDRVIWKKPLIYIYLNGNKNLNIKLDVKGDLKFTYPKYDNGWSVTTNSDGTFNIGDKNYSYLFWDGDMNISKSEINWNEGFIVDRENLISFFENTLSKMGLNPKEIEDYITYWCPQMYVNDKNYIHFMFNNEYNEYANLTVTPKPDNQFRVFMIWSKANEDEKIKEQIIPTFKREGFTLVEWGGAQVSNMQGLTVK